MEYTPACDVCGNEFDSRLSQCPFCKAARTVSLQKNDVPPYRVVNLEKGMPVVRDALARMQGELESSRLLGCRVLVLIHGYGSSGKGGAIRREVRNRLQYLRDKVEINDFLPGEECEKRCGRFRQMIRRFPFTGGLVRKPNPGITLVIL
jgi:hypothetical protein